MTAKPPGYKQGILNQLINFFWTILCFAPVLWCWIKEGINLYFYLFSAIALLTGILPDKTLNLLMLSADRRFYEKLGVKAVRKFVQNGDIVRAMTGRQKHFIINDVSHARQYLKTIAMYERYHWICFTFFLLTAILCFLNGHLLLGLAITVANIVYNVSAILLQQYNKIRIKKISG